jgi:mannosyl-3-phosphoglycerate phosphatase family protein
MSKKYIIFSDLDGTLLDHPSYSFRAANPALKYIKEKNIPLIFVSSKTKEEIEFLNSKMGLPRMPFIFENGAGIFIPRGFFPAYSGEEIIGQEKKYDEIVKFIQKCSEKYGHEIKGYHNMANQDLTQLTGLSGADLIRSKNRLFSLPLLKDRETERILAEEIANNGLNLLYGGRFLHLLANVDKGEAVRRIASMLEPGSWISLGLGDSPNDLEMLQAVQIPVLIRKFDGTYEQSLHVANMQISRSSGPKGWNESVIKILKKEGRIYE